MRRRIVGLVVAAAYLLVPPGGLAADRLVPSEYPTIQAAIDAAVDGDTVIIAPGTYTGDGNRDIDFKGKAIAVRGTDPNDPNIVEATVIDCNATQDEPHRGFYLKECVGAKISGLTIINGYAEAGGGIYCKDSSVTISNCRISDSSTRDGEDGPTGQHGTDGGNGGGIYCTNCSGVISGCEISENKTGNGGAALEYTRPEVSAGDGGHGAGVYCESSSLTIEDCTINQNTAGMGGQTWNSNNAGDGGSGAGIWCGSSSVVAVEGCTIAGNTAGAGGRSDEGTAGNGGSGGGVYCDVSSAIEISESLISSNVSGKGGWGWSGGGDGGDGAGLYCISASAIRIASCTLTNNVTGRGARESEHGSGDSGSGGGIYCRSAVVDSSVICDNYSSHGEPDLWAGGRAGSGGGIYCTESLTLINSAVTENSTGDGGSNEDFAGRYGGDGGGVWCFSGIVVGCNISDNATGNGGGDSDMARGGYGGGLYCVSSLTVAGSRIAANTTGNSGGRGGGVYCDVASISDCEIIGNSTGDGSNIRKASRGGIGGGVCANSLAISNSLVAGNSTGDGSDCSWDVAGSGGDGAGIWCRRGGTISNCTIADNVTGVGGTGKGDCTDGDRGKGGGVYSAVPMDITGSIIWRNSPEAVFGHDCNNVSYCDIAGDICLGGEGNISTEPLFATGRLGDYYLSQVAAGQAADSPCVDAGSDLAVNLGLDKFTTRTDNVGDQGVVDMGYHHPVPCLADIDGDGVVDMKDYAILAAHWAKPAMSEIPKGDIVVDGDLSEWEDTDNWIALDKVYYGNPADVSEARCALRWNPDTDKIYAAVIVYDSNHWFSDEYVKWNASDRIEIYCQGNPEGGTGWLRIYDIAQQYMLAPDTSGGSWATWAYGENIGEDAGLEYAVTVDGDRIVHEAGVLMFDNYGGFSGDDTVVTDLEPGHVVGFDLLVNTRWAEDGFGMLSENMMTGESGDAGQFARYLLVERIALAGPDTAAADLDGDGRVDWPDVALLADDWLWPHGR